jgi:hypothetical protein
MAKQAISVTLDTTNITWLKARVGATSVRSISALLDRLIADARAKGAGGQATSVVGTIDIDAADPLLERADMALRGIYDLSVKRPLLVKEARPSYTASPGAPRGRRRG